jgi:acetyl/propionyl-CoA carboxylase alpha subunit
MDKIIEACHKSGAQAVHPGFVTPLPFIEEPL